MQFESPSTRLELIQGAVWRGARSSVGGGAAWSALIVFLLAFAIAGSTATYGWVSGLQVIPLIALLGAVLTAALAVSPIPWPAVADGESCPTPVSASAACARRPALRRDSRG